MHPGETVFMAEYLSWCGLVVAAPLLTVLLPLLAAASIVRKALHEGPAVKPKLHDPEGAFFSPDGL